MSDTTVKGVLLLAVWIFSGSVSALENSECARYVKKPGDSVVLQDAPLSTDLHG